MIRDIFKHKTTPGYGGGHPYVSPYLLEVLSTRSGAPQWLCATGTLTANTGQVVTNAGLASGGYCLGRDGLLHWLAAGSVRVEPLGLLSEGAATNTVLYSNTFSNAAWTLQDITVAQNATGPDGVSNSAWTVTATAGNADHRSFQSVSNTGSASIYAKAGTVSFMQVYGGGSGGSTSAACFNLSNGTVAATQGGGTGSIEALANGWYRCTFHPNTSLSYFIYDLNPNLPSPLGDTTFTAAGTETIQIFGAMHETTTFPTSYIPTTSGTVTRDADLIRVDNPLYALVNPANWRWAATAVPMCTWTTMPDSVNVIACLGVNAVPNSARLYASGGAFFNTVDNPGLILIYGAPGILVGSNTLSISGTDTGGLMAGAPSMVYQSGGGTGVVDVQPIDLWMGNPGGLGNFRFWGHMTDVYVDNT